MSHSHEWTLAPLRSLREVMEASHGRLEFQIVYRERYQLQELVLCEVTQTQAPDCVNETSWTASMINSC